MYEMKLYRTIAKSKVCFLNLCVVYSISIIAIVLLAHEVSEKEDRFRVMISEHGNIPTFSFQNFGICMIVKREQRGLLTLLHVTQNLTLPSCLVCNYDVHFSLQFGVISMSSKPPAPLMVRSSAKIRTKPYQTTEALTNEETSISLVKESEKIYNITLDDSDPTMSEAAEVIKVEEYIPENPTILFWNPIQYPTYPIPDIPLCGGGCKTTKERAKFVESDAILFTMKEFDFKDLPFKDLRRQDQVYVYWTEESAWASNIMYRKELNRIEPNYFNWTMTFKRSSDVNAMMIPYKAREFVEQRLNEYDARHNLKTPRKDKEPAPKPKSKREVFTAKRQAVKFVRRKVKMAVWVASNCGYTAGAVLRRSIVTKLQFLGLKVDIFGKCGEPEVPKDLGQFVEMLSQYRFYLAFENALHCREYITEKFWYNSLYAGVVPVVWGPLKSDIEAVAPPNSYIHYDDFKSAEELVNYLILLSESDEEYQKYFAWWWETPGFYPVLGVTETAEEIENRQAMFDFEMNALCHLCSKLSEKLHKTTSKSIYSLHDWWYSDETTTCLNETHDVKVEAYGEDNAYKVIST